jgi:hypothetical protein
MKTGNNTIKIIAGITLFLFLGGLTAVLVVVLAPGDTAGGTLAAGDGPTERAPQFTELIEGDTELILRTTDSTTMNSGDITITTGDAGTFNAGDISIFSGRGAGGGDIQLDCGRGYTTYGGGITLNAGDGAEGESTGGAIYMSAGDGWTTGGTGGELFLEAGSARNSGDSNANGGNLVITSGSAVAGTAGDLEISAGTGAVGDGNLIFNVGGVDYLWPTTTPNAGDYLEVGSVGPPVVLIWAAP